MDRGSPFGTIRSPPLLAGRICVASRNPVPQPAHGASALVGGQDPVAEEGLMESVLGHPLGVASLRLEVDHVVEPGVLELSPR